MSLRPLPVQPSASGRKSSPAAVRGVTWWSKAVNRSCLFFRALSRTPCNPWDTRSPLCVGRVLDSMMFSLVSGLPSTTSAAGVSADFVRLLRRYYARVRLLAGVHARIALLASRPIRSPGRPLDAGEVSRFSRVQFLDVRMALGLRRACRKLALSFPPVWPSRGEHSVGARIAFFEARFLARRCLCLRFTRHLTAPSARLEVKMVRYSFLVGLFHPRLHAGLSRRTPTISSDEPFFQWKGFLAEHPDASKSGQRNAK